MQTDTPFTMYQFGGEFCNDNGCRIGCNDTIRTNHFFNLPKNLFPFSNFSGTRLGTNDLYDEITLFQIFIIQATLDTGEYQLFFPQGHTPVLNALVQSDSQLFVCIVNSLLRKFNKDYLDTIGTCN